jgi:hypothetical protein
MNSTYKNGIKIMVLEGSDILKNNLDGWNIKKDYKAVFADSLLLDKLVELKLNVKDLRSRDIITLNFNYGYSPKQIKELEQNVDNTKNDVKQVKKKITELNQKIKNEENKQTKGNDRIHKLKVELEDLKIQLLSSDTENIEDIKKTIEKNNNKIVKEQGKIKASEDKVEDFKKDLEKETLTLSEKNQEQQSAEEEIKEIDLNADEVRAKLYQEGFYLDFIDKDKKTKEVKPKRIFYKLWFRSPSKSRTGEVTFIKQELLERVQDWQRMGLKLPLSKAKLVEMMAYESLTSSHLVDRITIDPNSILVVNDLESYVEKMCAKVNYHVSDAEVNPNDTEDMCFVSKGVSRVKNTLWDGMALGDISFYKENNYSKMYLLRQHFFKAAMFAARIVEFLKEKYGAEYETATVKDRYKNDIPVNSIRVITTENALKFEKFENLGATFNYWKQKVNEDGNVFGIAKQEHESRFGEYQRLSYQHLNSLPVSANDIEILAKDTVDFVNKLKDDNGYFINYLRMTQSETNSNSMIIDLYNRNKNFVNTNFYRTFKSKTISEYKETLRAGKLLTTGDNLTICGNPYLLLLHAIGEVKYNKIDGTCVLDDSVQDITLPAVNEGVSIYTTKFNKNEKIALFRNPHNSPSNIALGTVYKNELMEKYFDFSNNIISINMIQTDIQDRLNGMDEDSDFCLSSNSKILVKSAILAQREYPTIINCIEKENKSYNNTNKDKANIDNGLAKGKFDIGVSSNVAQLALSWMWKNQDSKELKKELEDIVSIMSVLAQCAIDNSKRKYAVDITKEIARIRKLKCMQVYITKEIVKKKAKEDDEDKTVTKDYVAKPHFWQFVKELKEDNKETDSIKIKKVSKVDADGNAYTEDQIKEQKADNLKEYLEAKTQAKTQAKQDKKAKKDKLKEHCLQEKVCPMDRVQTEIDKIIDIKTNQYSDDPKVNVLDLLVNQVNTKERIDKRQVEKVEKLVKGLDDMYKEHYDNKKADDEAWESEQMIKTEETLKEIDKIKISEATMKHLVEEAFTKKSKYTRKLLNCLYGSDKNRERFLNTFIAEK